jgi:hypothetical protein
MSRWFRPLKSIELAELERRLGAALAAWNAERVPRVTTALTAGAAGIRGDAGLAWWRSRAGSDEAYFRAGDGALTELARSLVKAEQQRSSVSWEHPVVLDFARLAIHELILRLVGLREEGPPEPLATPDAVTALCREGSGAARMDVRAGAANVEVILPWAVVARLLHLPASAVPAGGRAREMSHRWRAIEGCKVGIEVALCAQGLSVRDLGSLRVNDVIAFDEKIDPPLRARAGSGADIGACYLGRAAGRRAILCSDEEKHP